MGVSVYGYSNNLALGKLTLDGGQNSLFHFDPPTGQSNRAIYVDYLELRNFATNYFDSLAISPGITIYFANSNVDPGKLDVSNGGRLRWIQDFTGPLSSITTNFTYLDGITYTFTVNLAVLASRNLDSDGDGLVNAVDPTPFFEPNQMGLTISLTPSLPHKPQLTWHALARSTNRVEYISAAGSTNWQLLTNIINGPTNGTLKVIDNTPTASPRLYRIKAGLR
jgi:hypothetical protein